MPGLDKTIIDTIDHTRVIERVKVDIRTDFILAPHYNAIFLRAGDALWSRLNELLRSGHYNPDLPLTMSIPKERFFTRPGSILQPFDRFMYQALIDLISPALEAQLDRDRTFSHVVSAGNGLMFEPAHDSWTRFQAHIADICDEGDFAIRADIANYFERIPQHHLINLISSAGCPGEIVNLLEEMLLAFQERNSYGIVQGVYPSDVLGNFFLTDFDAYCDLHDIPSARYVDDMYMTFDNEAQARKGLVDLIERLRKDGLHLNEYKSKIMPTERVMREETEIDRLFNEIRDEVEDEMQGGHLEGYGFEASWEIDLDEEPENDERVQLRAAERLFEAIDNYPDQSDKIEKFCLPLLTATDSDVALTHVLDHLLDRPHMTRLYFSYLASFARHDKDVVRRLESVAVTENLISDHQRMFLLAALLPARGVGKKLVNAALKWIENRQIAKETRAIAAIFAMRHGNSAQKRAVRVAYENEPSNYVRSAILYSARYLPSAERKTCKKAWGAHDMVNALIAQTI